MSKKTRFKKTENYTFYLLLEKEMKEFFLGSCITYNLKNNYRNHLCGMYTSTNQWIKNMKLKGSRPCLFVLEEGEDTKENIYIKSIIWFHVLTEFGYTCVVDYYDLKI